VEASVSRSTPDSTTTERLLARLRAGDQAAFLELFDRHRQALRRVIGLRLDRRLRQRVDPSDLLQETQLEAFRRLPDFLRRQPMPFHLWLRKTAQERLGMARRFHIDAGRRSVKREATLPAGSSLQLAERLLSAGPSPSERIDHRELSQKVREAVAELSDRDREVLMMRNVEQLSNQDVAQVLGIDPATASQRYGRALLRLRTLLIQRGVLDEEGRR
jgi:RNA polymerase sigma-70 factor (ECF subfamily)